MLKVEAKYLAAKKLNELCRDLLYAKHGDDWAQYERHRGQFWDAPDTEMLELLDKILEFAERKPS